jgi:hypothetical protein
MPFKPVTIPAKPATDKLDLDQVAFNNFSFDKQYIGMDQICTIRYTPTLFNASQAASAESAAKIVTSKKPQGTHTASLAELPMEVLQALGALQAWLETVAIQSQVLEPAE